MTCLVMECRPNVHHPFVVAVLRNVEHDNNTMHRSTCPNLPDVYIVRTLKELCQVWILCGPTSTIIVSSCAWKNKSIGTIGDTTTIPRNHLSPQVDGPRRYIPPMMCVYRVSGGNSSDIVHSANRNRTIAPLGCNEHIAPWTDPIYIFGIWMVLVHNRGIFPMPELILMSVRRTLTTIIFLHAQSTKFDGEFVVVVNLFVPSLLRISSSHDRMIQCC
jgi:hypothetical protein